MVGYAAGFGFSALIVKWQKGNAGVGIRAALTIMLVGKTVSVLNGKMR
jgi:hypothetical protein